MSGMDEKNQCRLCLVESPESFSLFDENLIVAIESFAPIKISENDCLPTICCSKCLDDIYILTNFRSRIIKSDKILRQQQADNNRKEHLKIEFIDIEADIKPIINIEGICVVEAKDKIPTKDPFSIVPSEVVATSKDNKKSLNLKVKTSCEKVDDTAETSLVLVSSLPIFKPRQRQRKLNPNISVCKICGNQMKTANYKKHLQRHQSGTQICELCGATAKNEESLRGHMFYMHRSTAEQYQCKHCSRFFRYKYKYQLHIRKAHGGDRSHICEVCGKAFFTFNDLNRHIQMTHMKMRPYICEYCNKGFSSKYARRTHIRQHTDERPYKCEVCAEGFRQRVSLKTHLKSKHGINRISEKSINTPDDTATHGSHN